MATFIQWATSFRSKEVAPRVTWVCGDNLVLVEEVVEQTKQKLKVDPLNYQTFTVGAVKPTELWAGLYRLSIDVGMPTLTVIRDAQKIEDWTPLEGYLNVRSEGTGHIILVSSEDDFPRENPKFDQKQGDLKPHIKLVQGRGSIVRCVTPSAEELVKWVRAKLPGLSESVAAHLVNSSGHNTKMIRDVCVKLAVLKSVTVKTVDALVTRRASEEFTDCLIKGDKRAALVAPVSDSEITGVIRLLDSRVDLLHSLYLASLSNLSVRDTCEKYRLSDFLVRKYSPHARSYDATRRARIKRTLASLEEHAMSGARTGVVESVVALW